METRLIVANLPDVDTECLVVFALDFQSKESQSSSAGDKKPDPKLAEKDAAVEKAAAETVEPNPAHGSRELRTAGQHRTERG